MQSERGEDAPESREVLVLELDIPGYGALVLEHLVLDVNGTIAGALGAARAALDAADIVVGSIGDALRLLGDPRRLMATLRT